MEHLAVHQVAEVEIGGGKAHPAGLHVLKEGLGLLGRGLLQEFLHAEPGLAVPAEVLVLRVGEQLQHGVDVVHLALEQDLTQDRVFGMMTVRSLGDFFVPEKVAQARQAIQKGKRVLVYGVGATLLAPGDVLVYADITRWELQLRFRRGADNWRTARKNLPKLSKVKRGYFAEWRWGDKVKKACPEWTSTWTPPPRAALPWWRGRTTGPLWWSWPTGPSAWRPITTPACGGATG